MTAPLHVRMARRAQHSDQMRRPAHPASYEIISNLLGGWHTPSAVYIADHSNGSGIAPPIEVDRPWEECDDVDDWEPRPERVWRPVRQEWDDPTWIAVETALADELIAASAEDTYHSLHRPQRSSRGRRRLAEEVSS